MKTIKHILGAVMTFLMISSCGTIHEFPEDLPLDSTEVNLDLTLTIIELELELFNPTKAGRGFSKEDYDVRYIIEVYPENGTLGPESRILREEIIKASDEIGELNVKFKLNARKYTLLYWMDYVEKGTTEDMCYDTKSLLMVKIKRPYTGSHDTKDAFSGVKSIDLTPYRGEREAVISEHVELRRPFAKFELITTDLQKFIHTSMESSDVVSMPSKVVFTYLPSICEQYNVLTQRPERYSDKETFTSMTSDFSDTECTIAFDYVFVNGTSTNVAVRFDIYDQNDKLLNSVKNLLIPIRRNVHTIMRGEFLTKEFQGGGVGIEDGFDGEIIITIPD